VDISFEDDVTILRLFGVSFMTCAIRTGSFKGVSMVITPLQIDKPNEFRGHNIKGTVSRDGFGF
jgi:hypothetical protein